MTSLICIIYIYVLYYNVHELRIHMVFNFSVSGDVTQMSNHLQLVIQPAYFITIRNKYQKQNVFDILEQWLNKRGRESVNSGWVAQTEHGPEIHEPHLVASHLDIGKKSVSCIEYAKCTKVQIRNPINQNAYYIIIFQ